MNQPILTISAFPRGLWVGIGCQRGTSQQLIAKAFQQVFRDYPLTQPTVGIATIDSKASEVGLLEFSRLNNLPLKTFSAAILDRISVPNPGKIITQNVGTKSVAEAAAILAASRLTRIESLDLGKTINDLGVELLVSKQVFRLAGQSKAVTVAVAQCVN